jgi:hypothetical protein
MRQSMAHFLSQTKTTTLFYSTQYVTDPQPKAVIGLLELTRSVEKNMPP